MRPQIPFSRPVSNAHRSSRREFLGHVAGAGASCLALSGLDATATALAGEKQLTGKPHFKTRGVILLPDDITNWPWVEKAKQAGLTTIGTHFSPDQVEAFYGTDDGAAFQEECKTAGIAIEHELHSMKQLLPRELFGKNPSMFRMDEKGERRNDWNLCVHSRAALEVVCENAVRYAKILKSDTGRYFYWIDDGKPMCFCPKCKGLSSSDQSLLLNNAMAKALREYDPRAKLAHLSYHHTLPVPTQVKPAANIFLEFAPITRDYKTPFGTSPREKEWLEHLDANLELFGSENAQVLEYWLDESMFYRASGAGNRSKRHMVPIPWNQDVFEADLDIYGKRGIRHATTFAVMVHQGYVDKFGEPPLMAYGQGLKSWRPC